MNADIPQITSSNYCSNTTTGWAGDFYVSPPSQTHVDNLQQLLRHQPVHFIEPKESCIMPNTNRRIVQVFIADTDPNLNLSGCLLYKGEQVFTDATDQELFFEIPIKDILDKHNLRRAMVLDKEATKKAGKDVFLEPARIRDLKMVVVEIAKF